MRSCRIAPRIADKRGPPLACAHNGPPSDATPQRCSSQWDNQRHDQQVNGNCNLNSSPLDQFELWNKPQGSELPNAGWSAPSTAPTAHPIRRIIDHGFAPTEAPTFNGWGLFPLVRQPL